MTARPTETPIWARLQAHQTRLAPTRLAALFAADPQRSARHTLTCDGLTLDLSKNHLTEETRALLTQLAEAQELEVWRDRLLRGEKINASENRAVLHPALRSADPTPLVVDGQNVKPLIAACRARLQTFVDHVRGGRWLGATGQPIQAVVNIGIGGSDLGPRLVVSALRRFASGPEAHFVANADAADLLGLLPKLHPATTLFVVVSKAFATQETLLNAQTARDWLTEVLGEAAVARHFVAVSTNQVSAEKFGLPAENIFPLWDWVGGRFSLWSSVGLSIALALGWPAFAALLGGAAVMDEHFRTAPLAQNLPVQLALTGIWYRNFWRSACHAVLPYGERLRELPRYLQQLEMESNGKSVTREGAPVDYATAPALFGECGTVGQHSFHQWLHQGADLTPTDFIGFRHDDYNQPEHHHALLANLMAQTEALLHGNADSNPARANPGNKPSTTIWLNRLDPHHLGLLLALYEHKVFTQGIIWNINSFDQWGVELGKKLAAAVLERKQA